MSAQPDPKKTKTKKTCALGTLVHVSCREISEFLMAYVDGELNTYSHEEFERHLGKCAPCVHYLDGYRETIAIVRRCGRSELDPQERRDQGRPPDSLIHAILAARKTLDSSEC